MNTIAYRGALWLPALLRVLRPGTLLETFWALYRRRASRAALARLDHRLLADIGLSEEQARREASKPFWAD